jgi:hypothetical protein
MNAADPSGEMAFAIPAAWHGGRIVGTKIVVVVGGLVGALIVAKAHWNSPDLPDTEFRCDDDLGGFRWEGEHLLGSSSSRRLS